VGLGRTWGATGRKKATQIETYIDVLSSPFLQALLSWKAGGAPSRVFHGGKSGFLSFVFPCFRGRTYSYPRISERWPWDSLTGGETL